MTGPEFEKTFKRTAQKSFSLEPCRETVMDWKEGTDFVIRHNEKLYRIDVTLQYDKKDHIERLGKYTFETYRLTYMHYGIRYGNEHRGYSSFREPVLVLGLQSEEGFVQGLDNLHKGELDAFEKELKTIIETGMEKYDQRMREIEKEGVPEAYKSQPKEQKKGKEMPARKERQEPRDRIGNAMAIIAKMKQAENLAKDPKEERFLQTIQSLRDTLAKHKIPSFRLKLPQEHTFIIYKGEISGRICYRCRMDEEPVNLKDAYSKISETCKVSAGFMEKTAEMLEQKIQELCQKYQSRDQDIGR